MTSQLSTPRFRLGFLTHVQGRGDLTATYRNAQELFVVADELGFDVGWVAQHHAPLGRRRAALSLDVPGPRRRPHQADPARRPRSRSCRLSTRCGWPRTSRWSTRSAAGGSRSASAAAAASSSTPHSAATSRAQARADQREISRCCELRWPTSEVGTHRLHDPAAGWRTSPSGSGRACSARPGASLRGIRDGSNLLLNRAAYGYERADRRGAAALG